MSDAEKVRRKRERQAKTAEIETALRIGDVDTLRQLATSDLGLVDDRLRRDCWPLLLSIKQGDNLPVLGDRKTLRKSKHAGQVKLDVDRSIKRFPVKMPESQRLVLQEQLMDLILWVLERENDLHYYQGYHDICITVLQVCGARLGQVVARELSARHLRDFMCPTMTETTLLLDFIMPILKEEDAELHDFLQDCEVGTVFALSWLITWYGHVIAEHKYIVRLFDYFVATHPLMPLYVAAAMVLHCGDDVLDNECDMPTVHHHLTNIPQTLDMGKNLQKIIDSAHLLFKKHPPSYLAEKSKTYERCSIISEFRQLEPTVRLVDGPKISSSYRQVATAFAVGVSLFALYMNLFV